MPKANNPVPEQETAAVPAPLKVDVNITSTSNRHDSNVRANATVILNDCFAIKGVRVMMGSGGLFAAMPARRGQDDVYREMCHPITKEFAEQLNASVLSEYSVHLAQKLEESNTVRHVINPDEVLAQDAAQEQEASAQDMSM
jgi:stage V sporulation protein G